MKSNAYDIALEFVKAHMNGGPYRKFSRSGNFIASGDIVQSYAEIIAFCYDGDFYTTTQKFSATTSFHENVFRQAVLDLVEPERLVVVPDIRQAYELVGLDECAIRSMRIEG